MLKLNVKKKSASKSTQRCYRTVFAFLVCYSTNWIGNSSMTIDYPSGADAGGGSPNWAPWPCREFFLFYFLRNSSVGVFTISSCLWSPLETFCVRLSLRQTKCPIHITQQVSTAIQAVTFSLKIVR